MILVGNMRIQSSATNNLQGSYTLKCWKFNHSVISALQFGGNDLRTHQPVGLHITTANPCCSLGLCASSILKMSEIYCVKLRLYEGEPKTWIMRWWFRVNTKLGCLGGRDRAVWMPLGFIQDKEDSECFSDFIHSFRTSLRCMVFSLTTAPLTDDPLSVSPSCHMHKDPYFWRLAHENLHTRDFSTCWITGLSAALDLTLIFPDETSW